MVNFSDGHPSTVEEGWPPVVVASAFLTGVLVARNLQRRGVRVFVIDCDETLHGFSSIYGTPEKCPNPDKDPDCWLRYMRDLSARLGQRPVLMAASDQYVTAIGRFADELSADYHISPSAKIQAELAVKEGQIRLAERYGLPVPRTRQASSAADVSAFAREARFPVVMKPRQQRYWGNAPAGHPLRSKKLEAAESEARLLEIYGQAAQLSPDVILQELIEGPDTNKRVHFAVYRKDGVRVAHYTMKELRCLEYQLASIIAPVEDPKIDDVCDRFFRALEYRGTCEIELMWDARDNVPKMMDINPRFTGSGDALIYAGIDHAWLVYLDAIGKEVAPVTPTRRDFRHVMLVNEMNALSEQCAKGLLNWASLRRPYRRPVHFWDLDLRDWRLAWRTLRSAGRVLAGVGYRIVTRRQIS